MSGKKSISKKNSSQKTNEQDPGSKQLQIIIFAVGLQAKYYT
jgi:hypothetical protein